MWWGGVCGGEAGNAASLLGIIALSKHYDA